MLIILFVTISVTFKFVGLNVVVVRFVKFAFVDVKSVNTASSATTEVVVYLKLISCVVVPSILKLNDIYIY